MAPVGNKRYTFLEIVVRVHQLAHGNCWWLSRVTPVNFLHLLNTDVVREEGRT